MIPNKSLTFKTVSADSVEEYQYILTFSPFRLEQKINGQTTLIANKKDTLMFENYQKFFEQNPF